MVLAKSDTDGWKWAVSWRDRKRKAQLSISILFCRLLVITEHRESLYVLKDLLELPQRGAVGAAE